MTEPLATGVPSDNVQSQLTDGADCPEYNFRCGLLGWRPRCLQRATNIRAFLAAACFISCLQAAFSGYTASQVTTLEKRFAVGSSVIGTVNSFFEVGYIISVIFVSYVGSRGHVPMWISLGLFVMMAGALLWSVPHFLFTYNPEDVSRSSNLLEPLCQSKTNQSSPAHCGDEQSSGFGFLPIFFLAQLLIGAGSSPILTLAPPFIDDHVPPAKAPPMIASQYAAAAMGPVVGFALGALVLQYPAELFTEQGMTPDDPEWIGAWWVGFIILSIFVFIGAVLLLLFPRQLRGVRRQSGNNSNSRKAIADKPTEAQENGSAIPDASGALTNDANTQSTSVLQTRHQTTSQWSEYSRPNSRSRRTPYSCAPQLLCRKFESPDKCLRFSHTVRSLIRNRVYLVVCLCICAEMFMIIGFASFLPKYLEIEYHLSKSATSAIAGGLIVPAGAFGILVGGLILNRFKFRRRGAIRFVVAVNFFIMGGIASFFFLGCGNPPVAGITMEYPSNKFSTNSSSLIRWRVDSQGAQSVHSCNSGCQCNQNTWNPVCHQASGISFISPCLAGCRRRLTNSSSPGSRQHSYFNCNCTMLLHQHYEPGVTDPNKLFLTSGQCPSQCNHLVFFIIILTTCLFLTGVIQNPLLMVTMRSVGHSERSFALGVQFVIIRLLASLPSPIVFGRVIDGACQFWRLECGRRGDCAFVDLRKLNLYMTGLAMILKCIGLIFYIILLCLLRVSPSVFANNELGTLSSGAQQHNRKPSEPLGGYSPRP